MSTSLAAVATQAALRAGAIQKEKYGQPIEVHHKGEIDLVRRLLPGRSDGQKPRHESGKKPWSLGIPHCDLP